MLHGFCTKWQYFIKKKYVYPVFDELNILRIQKVANKKQDDSDIKIQDLERKKHILLILIVIIKMIMESCYARHIHQIECSRHRCGMSHPSNRQTHSHSQNVEPGYRDTINEMGSILSV